MIEQLSKVITVSVYSQGEADLSEKSLSELERLVNTAGGEVVATVMQLKNIKDPATYIGKGKLDEIAQLCKDEDIDTVVFDCELTPAQIKNIEDATDTYVIDRSMLILDIFALHAKSAEGKIQVELAQLKYTAPRLIGKGKEMSRLGGGIGTRGPGESKLEIDRRRIVSRIAFLEKELKEIEENRNVMRSQRTKSKIPKACIVGYTNAGKSSLLNLLTGANVLAEDKLFATLDSTTRKYTLPSGNELLLTDTVGFIRKLPHHLIHAFKSTLEEARYADFLIIVVDSSDDECLEHMHVTEGVLESLDIKKPSIFVFNKSDLATPERMYDLRLYKSATKERVVSLCTKNASGLYELLDALEYMCSFGKTEEIFAIPYDKQNLLNYFYENAEVKNIKYTDEYILIQAIVDDKIKGKFKEYLK